MSSYDAMKAIVDSVAETASSAPASAPVAPAQKTK
jgi:hypothetical protein